MTASGAGSDFKARVLLAVDLVDLVGRTVSLKRVGKEYKGLCPFHDEKTPSFKVDPARQFFYCFGCKASGNAIDFVMRRDRLEFFDAMRSLAEANGVEIPRLGLSKEKTGQRQVLMDANAAASGFFAAHLAQHGAAARQYLQQRGFSEASVKQFNLGLAPDAWDGLLKSAVGRKFGPQTLLNAGLAKARDTAAGGHYDTFRNRLMFPIRDESGRTIAFGGRVMPGSSDPAKYLNSPETEIFSKGRCIFGLDLARQAIVTSRTAVVVEGYTDVLMAHQYGAANVVSVLGTAMTAEHVNILRRFADRIVLLFDADAAGDAAVDRTVGLFLTQPVEIAIASIPAGLDPDEFIMKEGAEGFAKLLAAAPDALTYKWKQLTRRFESSSDLTSQSAAVQEYLKTLADARGAGPVDSLRWGAALARVARLTGLHSDDLNRRFKVTRAPAAQRLAATQTAAASAGPEDPALHQLLGLLLLRPQSWHWVQRNISPEDFSEPVHRKLAEIYWDYQQNEGEPVFNEFLGMLRDPALVELAVAVLQEVDALQEQSLVLEQVVTHVEAARGLREEQKLVATLGRTSDAPLSEQDQIGLLRQLQEKARRPDLRRI